jgi:hypothetical protein
VIRTPGDLRSTRLLGVAAIAGLIWMVGVACDSKAQMPLPSEASIETTGIWISRDEVRSLPTNGAAWEALVDYARRPVRKPDVSNQDDSSNVRILAKALYFARTGEESYAREVIQALDRIRGTEKNARTLAIGREVIAYVVAADLIELDGADRQGFEDWLRSLRKQVFQGRTIQSTHEDRPNNWGTHAGATRLAIAAYLGDRQEIERAAHVFRGWTGEAQGWQGFKFREDWWQPTQMREFAINPAGAMREGHPIGGVLPDDQRRAGPFRWPPPKENYVYEALQGAIEQAVLLERLGYDAWQWGDRALLRAFEWLHAEARYPAEGDDTWLPHIVNRAYAAKFPAPTPSAPGKGMGFADWTHGAKAPEPIKNP